MKKKGLWMIPFFLGIFSLWTVASETPGSAKDMGLDGKVFAGEIGKTGDKEGSKDDLVFRDGTFRSTACDKFGFEAAPYTVKEGEGGTIFEAEAMSAKEGKMKWKGTVKGDMATATIIWSKPGKAPQEMWYKGKLTK